MLFSPRPYQQVAIDRMQNQPFHLLALRMGTGKTVATLTALDFLLNDSLEINKVLIVAPKRVSELVWAQEALKWDHLCHLRFARLLGPSNSRIQALSSTAEIHIINRENFVWLVEHFGKAWPYDCVVLDENVGFKNVSSKSWRALKKIRTKISRLYLLTGTPTPNNLLELWPQVSILDRGERLGQSLTRYKDQWFRPGRRNGHIIYEWTLRPGAQEEIYAAVADVMLSVDSGIVLPDRIDSVIKVRFDLNSYHELEDEMVTGDVVAVNAAVLVGKLCQCANGAMYDEEGSVVWVHDAKLEALQEIVDQGEPVLCFTSYRHDQARILSRFPGAVVFDGEKSLKDWQAGKTPLLLMNPACLGADTQVLTELRGWVGITEVGLNDRVFDGVEFVKHQGCVYSGFKEVIEVYGIVMTPDHKLLINGKWVEGKDVRDIEKDRASRFERGFTPYFRSSMQDLWADFKHGFKSRFKKQQGEKSFLRNVLLNTWASDVWNPHIQHLARDDEPRSRQSRQKLWGSGYNRRPRMGRFFQFLQRHGIYLFRRPFFRKKRCGRKLLQRKLCLGRPFDTTSKQKNNPTFGVSRFVNSPCRIDTANGGQQNDASHASEPRYDRGRSRARCSQRTLRKESEAPKYSAPRKEKVYDLLNCGPRHRFLIRNAAGKEFISHNSGGHGVDGLQLGGNVIVWFGLTFSLDLYEQANARIHRSGQTKEVVIHHLVAQDTIDERIMDVLATKGDMQQALLDAVKEIKERNTP